MRKLLRFGIRKSEFLRKESFVLRGTSGISGKGQVVLIQKFSMTEVQSTGMTQMILSYILVEKMTDILKYGILYFHNLIIILMVPIPLFPRKTLIQEWV